MNATALRLTPSQSIDRSSAARAGHLALRARIESQGFAGYFGPEAYQAYMRHLRERSLTKCPDLASRGGKAHHKRYAENDPAGYSRRQRAGFDAAVAKHGRTKILGVISRAHAERRFWRLAHPTAGERALRARLTDLGYQISALTFEEGFEYRRWRDEGDHAFSPADVLLEAPIGPYYADALIPNAEVVIEVNGGVHKLHEERDARRLAFFASLGLRVIVLSNDEIEAEDAGLRLATYIKPLKSLERSAP